MSESPPKSDCNNEQCLIAEGSKIPISEITGLKMPSDPAIVAIIQDKIGTVREITGFRGKDFDGDGITRQVVSVACADLAEHKLIADAGLEGEFNGHQVSVTPEFSIESSVGNETDQTC